MNSMLPYIAPIRAAPEFVSMPEYERCGASKRMVDSAGRVLSDEISEDAYRSGSADVIEAFNIAHSWRAAALRPMHLIRADLAGKRSRFHGLLTAARLKRMTSIRRKLMNSPVSLYAMQDIGGCRGVLRSVAEVKELAAFYIDGGARYAVSRSKDDYIAQPKHDGYRSRHIVLKFHGDGDDSHYNRHRIEVQLRTKAQHDWATAVEAVGLALGQNMKSGDGDRSWLRLFQLMSAEIAIDEECPIGPGVSESENERRAEIRELSRELDAVNRLRGYVRSIEAVRPVRSGPPARMFILQYDRRTNRVSSRPLYYVSEYDLAERGLSGEVDTVAIEIDRVDDMRAAFPNYFMDVGDFAARLVQATQDVQSEGREIMRWWTQGRE